MGKIVVIGDIHGRLDLLQKSLKLKGIIDDNNRWMAENIQVVQMGDLIDRGPDSLKVIKFVHNLKKQAKNKNSQFHVILGNHEIMALFAGLGCDEAKMHWYYNGGDSVYLEWLKTTGREDYDSSWPCLPEFYEDFSPKGFYGKMLLSYRPLLEIDNILFSHGGVIKEIDFDNLNEIVKQIFLNREISQYDQGIFNKKGLFWLRDYDEEGIEKINKLRGLRFQVVGHTPKNGISVELGGKLVFVDVGINQNDLPCAITLEDEFIEIHTPYHHKIVKSTEDIFIPLVRKDRIKKYPYNNPKYKAGDLIKLFSVLGHKYEVYFKITGIIKDYNMKWYEGEFLYQNEKETRVKQGRWLIGHIDKHGRIVN
ncbi:metallophosphoesterase [Anaerobranca gottschalkii]|uniref:Calcineurin-like phosphoesterase n=1 Tax=Anaerobranca gottschalkii DSM 13577 TaxID=1120990 RepID=A0A1I0BR03_9FIRM|nr:metallophosphoesterase [Anaerobranca gottschalkii]SET09460.1 Calcineurin-like phosphoesterase [Anaerobranca gottschalkii DSM 13577]